MATLLGSAQFSRFRLAASQLVATLCGAALGIQACALPALAQSHDPPTINIPYSVDTPENTQYLDAAAQGGNASLKIKAFMTDPRGKVVWSCSASNKSNRILFSPDTTYFAAWTTAWLKSLSGTIPITDEDGNNPRINRLSFFWEAHCGADGSAVLNDLPALPFLITIQPPSDILDPKEGLLVAHAMPRLGKTTEIILNNDNIARRGDVIQPALSPPSGAGLIWTR